MIEKKNTITLATHLLRPPKDGYAVACTVISETASLWPETIKWLGKNVAVTFSLRRKCHCCVRYHFPYIQSGLSLSQYFM